jgi:hypothetical protein
VMDRDDARAPDDNADWVPVFTAHTPADEVTAWTDIYADRAVADIRAHLAALPLTPDARDAVEPQLRRCDHAPVHAGCLRAHPSPAQGGRERWGVSPG